MVNMLPVLLAALKFWFIIRRWVIYPKKKKMQTSPNLPYLKWFSVKYLPHILIFEAAVNTIRMMVCRKRAFCSLLDSLSLPVFFCFCFFFFFLFLEAVEQPSTFRYMHAQLIRPTMLTFWLHRKTIGANQKSTRSIGESAIYERIRRRLASPNVRGELRIALARASREAGLVVPGSLKTILLQDVDHVVTVNC